MKINNKIKFFIALISLFYCITLIQDTYAKYISSADANANISIARWNILINEQDIKNNSNFTNTIQPTFTGTDHIASNIVAPTSTGYFDITIDGSNTDVSYQYTLSITHSEDNTVDDLIITKYTINGDDTEYTLENGQLQKDIELTNTNKTQTYRFYVEWIDNDNQTMDNSADTQTTIDGKATFDIELNVVQLAN